MDIAKHIYPELLFIVPFLNITGWWIKNKTKLSNNLIPLILGVISAILCFMYIMPFKEKNIGICICESVVQGVLLAASAVYGKELLNIANKGNKNDTDTSEK